MNIIIIESDDALFDRLKQDIKDFSPYVEKIYRCTYHEDFFKIDSWYNCKMIIANNPENAGLDFFKSLYLNPITRKYKIFGLIYTRGHANEIQFYREIRFLFERSNHLFLGVIYKRYGSLEKVLELIQNIACGRQPYPIIDWMQPEEKVGILEPSKLILLRNVHNLKHKIYNHLQPLILILTEFNDNRNVSNLRKKLKYYKNYFKNFNAHYLYLKEDTKKLLQYKYKDNALDFSRSKSETSYYVKQLKKFIAENAKDENGLVSYVNFFNKRFFSINRIILQLVSKGNNGSIERFLTNFNNFTQSLNRLIDLLDEHYFLK